jgi:hypothetical protein
MNIIGRDLKVKHTTNYSKFSVLPMNRGIDSKHVQKMITSIRKMGVIRCVIACTTNIIEGTVETYIIDGQHLATALERENQPIPYIEVTVSSEEDLIEKMAYLNNSSKSWDLLNYINAWKMIRPDYMKLFKWKNMYDIEILMLAMIAVNNPSIRTNTSVIKTGDFVISNPSAENMCKAFNDIFLKIGKTDRSVMFNFLVAFMHAYNAKYDHQKTIAAIDKHIKAVRLMTQGPEANAFIRQQIFKLPK